MFVNQNAIQQGDDLFQTLEGKMDMGGITEKDKLIYTANPQGIFDFASASRGLIRPTEFYCEELKELITTSSFLLYPEGIPFTAPTVSTFFAFLSVTVLP